MKTHFLWLFFISTFNIISQNSDKDYRFGIVTTNDRQFKSFEKDSTANAVVLYEHGDTKFIENNYRFFIKTVVYKKIKILNKEGFEHANVSIPFYKNNRMGASVKDIKAITHNTAQRISLKKEDIYTTEIGEGWSETTFTLPNVQEGSIIEYMYTIESPFIFNFKGWEFQSDLPKLKSVFNALIPGNFIYNRTLFGNLKLTQNNSSIKRDCFQVTGSSGIAECEVVRYEMENIPRFIEEDYLTSKKNFLSRISFELMEYRSFDGTIQKYSTTWKSVDNDYKRDGDIGGQLKKKSFFKDLLPENILNESDNLKKAKNIYNFIQNHYSWNGEYKLFKNMNVKNAFRDKVGTVGEINMSLINALISSGFKADLALLSTRKNGYPTKLYPVITDFNYIVVRLVIDENVYYLDATEKNNPFGVLPYRCLNRDIRIMDFKNGSYWETITPIKNNSEINQIVLNIDNNGDFHGNMRIINNGYSAISKRNYLEKYSSDDISEELESKNDNLEILKYKIVDQKIIEKPIRQEFEITLLNDNFNGDKVFLNPFLFNKIEENPFKLEERHYPVDFGYPRSFKFMLSMELPSDLEIESLPQNKSISLPENKGSFKYTIQVNNSKVSLIFSYSLNKAYFYNYEYEGLKEIFKQMILSQNEPIVLRKI